MMISEVFRDAIRYDLSLLAHGIYWALSKGLCRQEDDEHIFWNLSLDYGEVEKLKQNNVLGLQLINCYIMPVEKTSYMVVLAEDEKSARSQYYNELGSLPEKVIDITHKMETSFYYPETKEYRSIREDKEKAILFPKTVMIIDK